MKPALREPPRKSGKQKKRSDYPKELSMLIQQMYLIRKPGDWVFARDLLFYKKWQEGQTLKAIGAKYFVCGELVRLRLHRVCRWLKHPVVRKHWEAK